MSAQDVLLRERAALCATFDEAGPEAPTLCEGWLTADLAAHLLVRETRPDAGLGILLPGPFARHTQNVMDKAKQRGYSQVVDALRTGPPRLFRMGPMAAANVVENWIHHEDVRRANGQPPRPADAELDDILWQSLRVSTLLAKRRLHDVGLTLRTPDGRERVVRDGQPMVTLMGAPGELVLFMSGRKEAALVTHEGPPEAHAVVLAAKFGL